MSLSQESTPSPDAPVRVAQLRSLLRRGLAVEAGNAAMRWRRLSWGAHEKDFETLRGAVALSLGRHTEAISRARRGRRTDSADSSDSSDVAARLVEAEACLELRRFDDAKEALLTVSMGSHARAALLRSRLASCTGEAPLAVAECDSAIHLAIRARRTDWHAEALTQRALLSRSHESCEVVVSRLNHALKVASSCRNSSIRGEVLALRADVRCQMGDWNGSERDASEALSILARLELPHEHMCAARSLALVQLARLDHRGAQHTLHRALELLGSRGSAAARMELRLLLSDTIALGTSSSDSLESASHALSLCPQDERANRARIHVRCSTAAFRLGNEALALCEARRAVQCAPRGGPFALAQLVLGRVLLRRDRVLSHAAFLAARNESGPVYAPIRLAAELGLALSSGASDDSDSVCGALQALVNFGDRRFVEMAKHGLKGLTPAATEGFGATRGHVVPEVSRACEPLPGVFGSSPAMAEVATTVRRVAPSSLRVLIYGETGTGKELIARALHELSKREGSFVAVSAANFTDELFESEVFGHVKGAFTNAISDRAGLVEEARGGTLFIDEVADLSPRNQARLLRFLQDGSFRRAGESRERRVDVRVIAAANQRLAHLVAEGKFREDLLYRLRDIEIDLPPLRDRGPDVVSLARHFIDVACRRAGRDPLRISAATLTAIRTYPWPGNVRELIQEMQAGVVLSQTDVFDWTPRANARGAAASSRNSAERETELTELCAARHRFEREHIAGVLASTPERSVAASRLGISRQALHLKMRRYGLE